MTRTPSPSSWFASFVHVAVLAVVAAVVLAPAAGCRGKSAATGTANGGQARANGAGAMPAGASPLGYCSVTVSGGMNLAFTAPAEDEDFDTDYWRTDAETRELVRAMIQYDEYQTFDDDEDYLVEQTMARDPRLVIFGLLCSADAGTISFVPGRFSRYADVPFRPRTYEIGPAPRIEAVTSGVFFANVDLGQDAAERHFVVTSPGQLNVSVFNELQMAGTFSFDAASADGIRVSVTGRFDYRKPKPESLE